MELVRFCVVGSRPNNLQFIPESKAEAYTRVGEVQLNENIRSTSTTFQVAQATVPDTFLNCVPYDKNRAWRWVLTKGVGMYIAKDMAPKHAVESISMIKVILLCKLQIFVLSCLATTVKINWENVKSYRGTPY